MYKLRSMVLAGTHLLTRLVVGGVFGKIPKHEPCLFCPNHSSLLDGVILGGVVTWHLKKFLPTLVHAEAFNHWFFGYCLRSSYCIPINRNDNASIKFAMQKAFGYLKSGMSVGIFPEGKLNDGTRLRIPRPGASILALSSGVPIIPVGIRGTDRFLGKGFDKFKRPVTIHFGNPIDVKSEHATYINPSATDDTRRELISHISAKIIHAIADLSKMQPPRQRVRSAQAH